MNLQRLVQHILLSLRSDALPTFIKVLDSLFLDQLFDKFLVFRCKLAQNLHQV